VTFRHLEAQTLRAPAAVDIVLRELLSGGAYTEDPYDLERQRLTADVAQQHGVSRAEWEAWQRWRDKPGKPRL
jgi:hypothetical protein